MNVSSITSIGLKATGTLILVLFVASQACAQKYKCLPPEVSEETVMSVLTLKSANGTLTTKTVTVKQTLAKMKAKCRHGKIVDRRGRQIRFYYLRGCWGNPPEDYQEILENQRKEIADLKKKFTVIEIPCNPNPLLPPAAMRP